MSCDLWSLGIVTYTLLIGCFPYNGKSVNEMYQNICSEPVSFTDVDKARTSKRSRNFVRMLLYKNADNRFTWKQALSTDWIKKILIIH